MCVCVPWKPVVCDGRCVIAVFVSEVLYVRGLCACFKVSYMCKEGYYMYLRHGFLILIPFGGDRPLSGGARPPIGGDKPPYHGGQSIACSTRPVAMLGFVYIMP